MSARGTTYKSMPATVTSTGKTSKLLHREPIWTTVEMIVWRQHLRQKAETIFNHCRVCFRGQQQVCSLLCAVFFFFHGEILLPCWKPNDEGIFIHHQGSGCSNKSFLHAFTTQAHTLTQRERERKRHMDVNSVRMQCEISKSMKMNEWFGFPFCWL